MLTKHQLRVVGPMGSVSDFMVRIGAPAPVEDFLATEEKGSTRPYGEEFVADLSSLVSLNQLSSGFQVVSALDESAHVLRRLRSEKWGVEEVPYAHPKKVWKGLLPEEDTIDSESCGSGSAGVILGFRTRCAGTLCPFVENVSSLYPELTFRLLWVHWPSSVAAHAGAFFPEKSNAVVCPSPSAVENFVRTLGWLGDRGFNDNFFYRSPGSDMLFAKNQENC